MTCEQFVVRAADLKLGNKLSHDEYWALVLKHYPEIDVQRARKEFTKESPVVEERYIPKGFRDFVEAPMVAGRAPFDDASEPSMMQNIAANGNTTLTIDGETFAFVKPFRVAPNFEEKHIPVFHEVLKNYMADKISLEVVHRWAADPGAYDAMGIPIPEGETAEPVVGRFLLPLNGEKKIDVTVTENTMTFDFGDQQYVVPEVFHISSQFDLNHVDTLRKALHSYWLNEVDDLEVVKKVASRPWMYDYQGNPLPARPEFAADAVNHPSHYTQYKGVEVIDIAELLTFNRGNAVKYVARAGHKSKETEIQDLEKALWYVRREMMTTLLPICTLPNLEDLEPLVFQMSYNRGLAVWHISAAGRIGNNMLRDLEAAEEHICEEIKWLKKNA
jgi:hypothetical protein